ncbi:MAG: DedA family protein [Paracoccaceae bacterium]
MDAIAQTFIGWIERHQAWLPLIMVVFAAAETTAFLSILIPSTAIMVAVGALAASDNIALFPLWVGATIGAMIGSFISYWLGRRYGGAVLAMRPLSDHPDMVARAREAFVKYGPATVLIGHFMTFLRPVVFLLAGMTGMTAARFAFWNVLGCAARAFLIPKAGEFGGDILGWLWSLFT